MKRLITLLLMICMLMSVPQAVRAEEITDPDETVQEPNWCGENLTWTLDGGTLTISGSGEMASGAPWSDYQSSIHTLILTGGVTTVAEDAFAGYTALTKIDFGSDLREIGPRAFQGCTGLRRIDMPASFRKFGESCFQDCTNLSEVHCAGAMPSFKFNCLWNGSHITVYYPANKPWGLSYVEELERNFGGRLEVLDSDGKDPLPNGPDATEATTQPPTEPTTRPTETEMPTIPEPTTVQTEPQVTPPPTLEPTSPEPTPTQEQSDPTQEPEPARRGGGMALVIFIGAVGLISAAVAIVLAIRVFRPKGGKYLDE